MTPAHALAIATSLAVILIAGRVIVRSFREEWGAFLDALGMMGEQ